MLTASEIRVGNIVKIDGKMCKVLFHEIKGHGKVGKTVHLKLKCLQDGNTIEKGLRAEEKVEDFALNRVKMQYLYKDGQQYIFMNTQTYEQFPLAENLVGKSAVFLKENSEIDVDFVEEKAVGIDFPKAVELQVLSAPPPLKGGSDSTYKEVELEHGVRVLVPQFVKEGEFVRINTQDFSYLDRVTKKSL